MHVKTIGQMLMALVLAAGCQAASAQVSMSTSVSVTTIGTETVAHGGGCRKDSPPGQCCHAGSQPYHCH